MVYSLWVLYSACFALLCCVLWAEAVFTGHTSIELLWRPFSFSQGCPRPALFSHQQHWSPQKALALHWTFTQGTAWLHVNHGRHPFFPRAAPVTIVKSACPEALHGKINAYPEKSHSTGGINAFLLIWFWSMASTSHPSLDQYHSTV